jgi:HEAT repeats
MTRALVASCVLAAGGAIAAAQQPQIQNGRVETRSATSIDRALAGLGATDPVWAAWRVPMIDGEGSHCSWYVDDNIGIRGFVMENGTGNGVPQLTPPTGPVPLEAGTALIVFVRLVDGQPERIRALTDDCPVDAGGRTLYWLDGVTPAESLRYLATLANADGRSADSARRVSNAALSAISLHRDPAADALLDRLAASPDSGVRRQAGAALGAKRGAQGFQMLQRMLVSETDQSLRRAFASALGQTRQPGTAPALLALARTDRDAGVRGEAVYWYAQRAGSDGLSDVRAIIDRDDSETVQRRGVSGLARLPADDAVPQLIELARSSQSLAVRKEAVLALGRTKDPRAVAFLEALLKR